MSSPAPSRDTPRGAPIHERQELSGAGLLGACLGLAALDAATGRLGMLLAVEPGFASAFFPPSGLALGALLVFGWRLWPGVFLGSLALNVLLSLESGAAPLAAAGPALGIALGSTLQALVAWRLLGGGAPRLADLRDVARSMTLAGPVACLIAPTVGVASLRIAGIGEGSVLVQWGTWWVGDVLGVLLLTPMVLAFLGQPRASWRRRRSRIVAPLLIAFALAGFIYDGARRTVRDRSAAELDRAATGLSASMLQSALLHAQLVRATADLYRASEHVSEEEFEVFTRSGLTQHAALRAIEWVARVPAARRSEFVAEARAAGHPRFEIRQLSDGEWVVPPRPRGDAHSVVRYIRPLEGNRAALGLDLGSSPERARTLRDAATSREIRATPIIELAQGGRGVLLFEPIFEGEGSPDAGTLAGFALGVVDVDALLANTLAGRPTEGLRVALLGVDAPSPATGLERDIPLGGQVIRLHVARARSQEIADAWEVWLTLLGGLLFCALLSGFLLVTTGQSERVEALTHRFRATLESAPIPIVMSDAAGSIVLANAATEELLGHSADALRSMKIEDLVPERYVGHHGGLRARYLEDAEARTMGDGRDLGVLHADGSEIAVEIGLSPVEVDGQRFVLSAIVDIRDRVERERALAESNEALLSSNQDLSRFAHIASHDLQSPLRSISGFVQLLSRRYGDAFDEKGQRWMKHVVEGVARMQGLIRELLELSRVEGRARPFESLALDEIVADAFTALHASVEDAGASLEVSPLPSVSGDRTQLTQLFTNLVGNAIHYNESDAPRVQVRTLEPTEPGFVSLAVDDDGIGIAPEHRERVFEVFKRLHGDDKYPGTGIGLAICRKVAERHGGTIRIEDSPLGGSRFVVTLARGDLEGDGP